MLQETSLSVYGQHEVSMVAFLVVWPMAKQLVKVEVKCPFSWLRFPGKPSQSSPRRLWGTVDTLARDGSGHHRRNDVWNLSDVSCFRAYRLGSHPLRKSSRDFEGRDGVFLLCAWSLFGT
jgi:hypothetical protein